MKDLYCDCIQLYCRKCKRYTEEVINNHDVIPGHHSSTEGRKGFHPICDLKKAHIRKSLLNSSQYKYPSCLFSSSWTTTTRSSSSFRTWRESNSIRCCRRNYRFMFAPPPPSANGLGQRQKSKRRMSSEHNILCFSMKHRHQNHQESK